MAVLHLVVCFLLLSTGLEGVTIIVPSEKRIVVEFGQEVTLWCNFSYTGSENGNTRVSAWLNLNDTGSLNAEYLYEQNGGSGGNDYSPALQNHFHSRTDMQELREPLAIGLSIQHVQWNDSGNYTWSMIIDRLPVSAQQNVHTNEVIVGMKDTTEEDTTPKPLEAHYIAIIVVSGCCVVAIVIIAVVCIHKHSAKKRQANPDKENTTGAGVGNQYDEMPMDNSKYQQEQEKKQQKDVKGRQHNQGPRGKTKPAGGDGRKKRVANADPNAEETEQEQEAKQQRSVKGPRGNTKPAGGDGRKKRVANADPNAEETEEQEEKQQLNVEGLQYADLDLRPTGKTKPVGGDGRNKLVFNDDSHVEYAEVRKV